MGLCSHCKPMQKDPPSLWNVEKKMKWNTSIFLSESPVRASDAAEAAVDECCVLTVPTDHTEVWFLPRSKDVLLFHLQSTNLAYTAHLSARSPPHILYRGISIMSSYSCSLCFVLFFCLIGKHFARSADSQRALISHSLPSPVPVSHLFGHVYSGVSLVIVFFSLYTVYSHTVLCIRGILEK